MSAMDVPDNSNNGRFETPINHIPATSSSPLPIAIPPHPIAYASAGTTSQHSHYTSRVRPLIPPPPSFQAAWARSPTRLAKPPAATDAPIRRSALPAPPALPTPVRKIRENEWRSDTTAALPWLREICYDHAPRLAVAGRLQRTPRRFIGLNDLSAGSIHIS